MEYQKACDFTLAEGLDLEFVYEDQNAEFYIKKGVKLVLHDDLSATLRLGPNNIMQHRV